ncbi:MAG: ATP-dependent DNA ligase [Candidatus Velthaea sp.]
MEMRQVADIPRDGGWQYEPKWDGFRALAFRDGETVELQSKSGQPLARYFPEVVAALQALPAKRFVLDGELVVASGGALAFDALQQRIHPAASRIARLAAETPAWYLVFDVLSYDGRELVDEPLAERRARLEEIAARFAARGIVRLSPATRELAVVDDWYEKVGIALDGVIAKRLDRPYATGERTAAVKIKRIRSADCVVGGLRFASGDREAVGSLLLGLYDDGGLLDYVGFTSAFSNDERRTLLKRLRPLFVKESFTGRTPGGPSRWNRGRAHDTTWQPLKPEVVVEVSFDQVTAGRFRHGTRPLRWRTDKAPRQCTLDQMDVPDRTLTLLS